ncbi:hypothetical protein MMC26_007641 [Xylographa opegraphella]|nr:hypothetical protein [Xylographa opegraphella]
MASAPKPHWPSLRERQSIARSAPRAQSSTAEQPFWEDRRGTSHPGTALSASNVAADVEGSSPLCEACRHYWTGAKQPNINYKHIRLLSTLQRTAADGCRFCELVRRKLLAGFGKERIGEELGLQLKVTPASTGERQVVVASFSVLKQTGEASDAASISLSLDQVLHTSPSVVFDGKGDSSNGEFETLSLVEKLLQQCTMLHKECRVKSAAEMFLPERLIDVESARDGIMRLVDSREIGKGENSYIIVTDDRGSKNPLDLQNAVKIAQWCKVKYIWIESLCVREMSRQDPKDGFETEQINKKDIFRQSFLTISIATTASQPARGSRRPVLGHSVLPMEPILLHCPWLQPTNVSSKNGDGSSESHFYQCGSKRLFKDNIEHPLLQMRGKALQERLLSARVLHIGAQHLFWECRELTACDAYPNGIPKCFNSDMEIQLRDVAEANVETWNRLVTTQPRSHFGSSSEMISIFLGIAEVFRRTINDEYVAGLWRSYLPFQLCWAVSGANDDADNRPPDPESLLSPSWSWLSSSRPVFWPMYPGQLDYSSSNSRLVKLLDVSNSFPRATNSDAPRRAEITVNGLIYPGVLEPQATRSTTNGNCSVRLSGLPRLRKPLVGYLDQAESIGAENVILLLLITDKHSVNVGGLILSLDMAGGTEMSVFERSLAKYCRLGYFQGAQHIKELMDDRIDRKSDGPVPKTGENTMFGRAKWSTCTLI